MYIWTFQRFCISIKIKLDFMYSLGLDIGSSSIKAVLIDRFSGKEIASTANPKSEMSIESRHSDWAEQDPEVWWKHVCTSIKELLRDTSIDSKEISSIGIAYQMHGLVLIDSGHNVLRPSIIWCDSRAVSIGEHALVALGEDYCFSNLLNGPGNFTASKLKWVMENEPGIFERIHKILLPGDFIAMKLTGEVNTTISGLSEGVFWDFKENSISQELMDYFGFDFNLIPDVVPTFGIHGKVTDKAAKETGLSAGIPITYRAGDQPNNALSLNVFHPGEIAATGGTSGVVYGVTDQKLADRKSRINSFAHVNHTPTSTRIGQLLCINGAGSQYAWMRKQVAVNGQDYSKMEAKASKVPIGSENLLVHPYGNGAERMLNNKQSGGRISGLQFNTHTREHLFRAALEGIAFSFVYGMECMSTLGIHPQTIKVGNDNLFQSDIFTSTISTLVGCEIQVLKTNGAAGAARAGRLALGDFDAPEDATLTSELIKIDRPSKNTEMYQNAYSNWLETLNRIIEHN